MRKLLIGLLILCGSIPAYSQTIRTFTLNATTQTGPVINLIGTGVYSHRITWSTTGTVSAGTCSLVGSADNVTYGTTIISAQTVTSSGGPTATAQANANYVKVTCAAPNTPIVGSGSVTFLYNGLSSAGSSSEVTILNPSLEVSDPGIGGVNDAACSAGGVGSVNCKLRLATQQYADMIVALGILTGTVDNGAQKIAGTDGEAFSPVTDECTGQQKLTFNTTNAGSATAVELVAADADDRIIICMLHVHGNSTSTEIGNILQGTQNTNPCDTNTAALDGSSTSSNGNMVAASGGGWVEGGDFTLMATSVVNRQVCFKTSGTNRVNIHGTYVKAP